MSMSAAARLVVTGFPVERIDTARVRAPSTAKLSIGAADAGGMSTWPNIEALWPSERHAIEAVNVGIPMLARLARVRGAEAYRIDSSSRQIDKPIVIRLSPSIDVLQMPTR